MGARRLLVVYPSETHQFFRYLIAGGASPRPPTPPSRYLSWWARKALVIVTGESFELVWLRRVAILAPSLLRLIAFKGNTHHLNIEMDPSAPPLGPYAFIPRWSPQLS